MKQLKIRNILLGVIAIIVTQAVSCGPMNGKPPLPSNNCSNNTISSDTTTNSSVLAYTKSKSFLIHSLIEDPKGGIAEKAEVGSNIFKIHLTHPEDFGSVGKNITATATFIHVPSKTGQNYPADVKKVSDNTFEVTVDFKKPGNWSLTIHFTDGSAQDDYEIPITI